MSLGFVIFQFSTVFRYMRDDSSDHGLALRNPNKVSVNFYYSAIREILLCRGEYRLSNGINITTILYDVQELYPLRKDLGPKPKLRLG